MATPKQVNLNDVTTSGQTLIHTWLYTMLKECESPIEEQMLLALYYVFLEDIYLFRIDTHIFPQYPVEIADGRSFRLDFLIQKELHQEKEGDNIVVECDGHDYHEKTKEQARKDKQRDRWLISKGLRVVHFTGSEIHKDAVGCACEVYRLLNGTASWVEEDE